MVIKGDKLTKGRGISLYSGYSAACLCVCVFGAACLCMCVFAAACLCVCVFAAACLCMCVCGTACLCVCKLGAACLCVCVCLVQHGWSSGHECAVQMGRSAKSCGKWAIPYRTGKNSSRSLKYQINFGPLRVYPVLCRIRCKHYVFVTCNCKLWCFTI